MLRNVKYSKIAIVIFFTVLIWVWADLTLEDELTVSSATVTIVTDPALWATFEGADGSPDSPHSIIKNIVLKGPGSRIEEVRRELIDVNDGSLKSDFSLHPEWEAMTTTDSFTLTVLDFIKRSDEIRELGSLTVESCEPNELTVKVVELVEKPLEVECIDESGSVMDAPRIDSIERSPVTIFAPGATKRALVKLTSSDIKRAITAPIEKTPYIVLPDGQTRQSSTTVRIKMLPDPRSDYLISAKLSYIVSPTVMGKYDVDVENLSDLMGAIPIRATLEAKQAYEGMQYHVMLEIDDEDVKATDGVRGRPLKYNFPSDYVARGEIELTQDPVKAQFKLIRRSPDENP
jgi:hypothetical protein